MSCNTVTTKCFYSSGIRPVSRIVPDSFTIIPSDSNTTIMQPCCSKHCWRWRLQSQGLSLTVPWRCWYIFDSRIVSKHPGSLVYVTFLLQVHTQSTYHTHETSYSGAMCSRAGCVGRKWNKPNRQFRVGNKFIYFIFTKSKIESLYNFFFFFIKNVNWSLSFVFVKHCLE